MAAAALAAVALLTRLGSTAGDLASDQAALLAFKASITHDPHGFLTDWHPADLTPCDWFGVACNGVEGPRRVIGLFLKDGQLNGTLAPELANIGSLKYIYLLNNSFSSPIPPALGNLPQLGVLVLDENSLTGISPPELGNCTSLSIISVNNNRLEGGVPPELADRRGMISLNLSHNRLSGHLPPELGRLVLLNKLWLASNRFSGPIPTTFSNLENLQVLTMDNNNFSGPFPQWLGNFSSALTISLGHNNLTGGVSASIRSLQSVQYLDISNNRLTGILPLEIGKLSNLKTFSSASNSFSGPIPEGIGNLPSLTYLDLSNNNLNGSIPESLGFIPFFNISNDNLSGPIPDILIGHYNSSSFSGNPALCGGPYVACKTGPPPPEHKSSSLSGEAIAGIVVGAVVLLLLLLGILLLCCLAWKKKKDKTMPDTERSIEHFWSEMSITQDRLQAPFTFEELMSATENFNDDFIVGAGGFGKVYCAQMKNGQRYAVKRLPADSKQGLRSVKAEVETLSRIRHRNLVPLQGWYIPRDSQAGMLLIYPFLLGGNLDQLVHGGKGVPPKPDAFDHWAARMKVILDAAIGLKYLHHECSPRVLHRDVKPNNTLLDEHGQGYVADFGLARVFQAHETHVSTMAAGTVGYLAPDCALGQLTEYSDVFSFGVVLLETVTGKRPVDPFFQTEVAAGGSLILWVRSCLNNKKPLECVDMALAPFVPQRVDEIRGALKAGLFCCSNIPKQRPTMIDVVEMLQNLEAFGAELTFSKSTLPIDGTAMDKLLCHGT